MGATWRQHLSVDGPGRMRIKKHGRMLADAMMISEPGMLEVGVDDRSPQQLVNTAELPGIVGQAWAMADWHFGYGFPIGGVVATSVEYGDSGGGVSPGGVGFDINCGVRLLSTGLSAASTDVRAIIDSLQRSVPAGATSKGGIRLTSSDLEEVLSRGARAACEMGLGAHADLGRLESGGFLETTERALSERALKRGEKSLGTLGSGNHFLEVQVVDRILDAHAAREFGLQEGELTVMIHSGSRGLGHQVCSDHVKEIESNYRQVGSRWVSDRWGFDIADRQLACAPIHSDEGRNYMDAMNSAGNFAFANRSALTQRVQESFRKISTIDADIKVTYDVSHNIAKFENHEIHGSNCKCCVHRKGATRAFSGDNPGLSNEFQGVGQPVLVPGDMGRASWVLAGPKKGENDAFSSSCHGAGRKLSRTAARKAIDPEALIRELEDMGIIVRAKTRSLLSEEAPEAYKNVDDVVRLTESAGLARPVARLRPLGVIKG
tara:strand:- start:8901 stop:10373 length:1473 start_codon:yes stop_codon:yes gene_type:complete